MRPAVSSQADQPGQERAHSRWTAGAWAGARRRGAARVTALPSRTVITTAMAANAAATQAAGRRLRGVAMICCPFRPRAMTVTCDTVRVPARQGGVLAGLGPGRFASVLAASLGRGEVNVRHLIGVIRCQRFR